MRLDVWVFQIKLDIYVLDETYKSHDRYTYFKIQIRFV